MHAVYLVYLVYNAQYIVGTNAVQLHKCACCILSDLSTVHSLHPCNILSCSHNSVYTHKHKAFSSVWFPCLRSLTLFPALQCSSTPAVRGFIEHVTNRSEIEILIIGADCSVASQPVASLAPFWNLVQVKHISIFHYLVLSPS